MKKLLILLCIALIYYSCKSSSVSEVPENVDNKTILNKNKPNKETNTIYNDTVRIANDSLEYEIIIFEPGFNFWLNTIARPRGYYSKQFLEIRNRFAVIEFNARVDQPQRFDPNLYPLRINYNSTIDYGYEVNYVLYNYFIFFQLENDQRLTQFVPRI